MTVLTVVNDVCAVVGVHKMTSLFAAATDPRTQFEMLALANEMAQRIAYDGREWARLHSLAIFQGGTTGVIKPDGTEAYLLPADYKRMLLTAQVWRSTSATIPMLFMSDTNEWTRRRMLGYVDSRGEWAIHAGSIWFAPALEPARPRPSDFPAWINGHTYLAGKEARDTFDNSCWKALVTHTSAPSGPFAQDRINHPDYWEQITIIPAQSVWFNYLSNNPIGLASGGAGDRFMSDNDVFLLPERLLKLGMIWQWKANKGSPYAEDMATFEEALARERGSDKPSPIISGPAGVNLNATIAYPYPTPTSADWAWPLR